jgi:phosphonoacetate hydrolase
MDTLFGRLDELGAIVALTADHGMNDKSRADGSPNVIWLQDILDARFGKGTSTVICPITDRFVVHHGALGGFVRVYCKHGLDPADVLRLVQALPGVEAAYDKVTTAKRFAQPIDREGDVAVIGRVDTCIGASAADHDLSGLKGHRLRTHGGLSEAKVPFIINKPLKADYAARAAAGELHSYQLFDFAINGVETS